MHSLRLMGGSPGGSPGGSFKNPRSFRLDSFKVPTRTLSPYLAALLLESSNPLPKFSRRIFFVRSGRMRRVETRYAARNVRETATLRGSGYNAARNCA
eukprot:4744923-Pyramimonas_sp.AAC.1